MPDEVEPRDNRLSAKGDETTEMMEGAKAWPRMMCFDFIRQRSDNAHKRMSSSVDTATVQGIYIKCGDKWVKDADARADAGVCR